MNLKEQMQYFKLTITKSRIHGELQRNSAQMVYDNRINEGTQVIRGKKDVIDRLKTKSPIYK